MNVLSNLNSVLLVKTLKGLMNTEEEIQNSFLKQVKDAFSAKGVSVLVSYRPDYHGTLSVTWDTDTKKIMQKIKLNATLKLFFMGNYP